MIDIQGLKKDDFASAANVALCIRSESDESIGTLIPIGSWALRDEKLLEDFADWRRIFMRFFLSQFTASIESTRNYLEKLSIAQSDRIFFGIYLEDHQLVGHIGLSNITTEEAELDNIIRGRAGGHPDLMYYAERTLLSWAFGSLRVKRVVAQVLSKNFMAANLHERFGFTIEKSMPLRKVEVNDMLRYVPSTDGEATEKFSLNMLELSRKDYQELSKAENLGHGDGDVEGSRGW